MDAITITGVVGSDPSQYVTSKGLEITSFRLASTHRFFDRAKGAWESGETNWYTVSAFRQLAANTLNSVRKGEHVVVHGRLRVRKWEAGEKNGIAVEIDADAIGHDLMWGTSEYRKVTVSRSAESDQRSETETDAATDVWPSGETAPTADRAETGGLQHDEVPGAVATEVYA